jgi:hypothetical protein
MARGRPWGIGTMRWRRIGGLRGNAQRSQWQLLSSQLRRMIPLPAHPSRRTGPPLPTTARPLITGRDGSTDDPRTQYQFRAVIATPAASTP